MHREHVGRRSAGHDDAHDKASPHHTSEPGKRTLTEQLAPVQASASPRADGMPGALDSRSVRLPGGDPIGERPTLATLFGGHGVRREAAGHASAAQGSARLLPEGVRAKMEHALGADFSSVRVHEGPEAEAAGAQAFTRGDELHFQPGAYDPHSASGQELLGHELAHVVQQRAGRAAAAQAKGGIVADAGLEAEADAAGAKAARGELATLPGSRGAASAALPVVQRKVYLGGKAEPEPTLPQDVADRLAQTYDAATVAELRTRVQIGRAFPHSDWDEAAKAAFHHSRRKVNPATQPPLWYGRDSEQRNLQPDRGGPAGPGQFRESAESRELADKLLGELDKLAKASLRSKKDTLGKGAEGEWKEAIMVGVMITVLGKRYAAKSGAMTDGFRQAVQNLGLHLVTREDDHIIGFGSGRDRTNDPVAQVVRSQQPVQSATEVGQAPGKCALPKLISEVAASKRDTPESATEKLFSPDGSMNVLVKGEGGEVAKHGHGCTVPSCITCRMLTELQLANAPTRDSVLSHGEKGYVENLDRQSAVKNSLAEEAEEAEKRRQRNRKHNLKKQGREAEQMDPVVAAEREPTDRASTWKPIQERVAATRENINAILTTAPEKIEAAKKKLREERAEAERRQNEAREKQLGPWARGNPLTGARANSSTGEAAVNEDRAAESAAVKKLWVEEIVPALKALCSELARNYNVPPQDIPTPGVPTVDAVRQHVARGLAIIEDDARSWVARAYGRSV